MSVIVVIPARKNMERKTFADKVEVAVNEARAVAEKKSCKFPEWVHVHGQGTRYGCIPYSSNAVRDLLLSAIKESKKNLKKVFIGSYGDFLETLKDGSHDAKWMKGRNYESAS